MASIKRKRGWQHKWHEAGSTPPEPPFNPGHVAEVVNWYDVTDSAARVVSAGRVTQLTDKKGSRDITQSLTAYPSFSASGGGNDLPFMTVDPTQYIFDDLGSFPGSDGAISFAVFRIKSLTPVDAGGGDYLKALISYYQRSYGLVVDNLEAGYGPYFVNGGNYHSLTYSNGATTDWQVVSFRSAGTGDTSIQWNDQPIGQTCLIDFGVMGPTNIYLGYQGFSANFEFAELIIADSSISAANTTAIRNYLIEKYSPTSQPYIQTFGDSLTAGNCGTTFYWPKLVAASLGVQLVNYGWGGTIVEPNGGATGVADRNLSDVYQNINGIHQPDWLVYGFGVNDINQSGVDGSWKGKYVAKIQYAIDQGIDPDKILITLQPSTTIREEIMSSAYVYITEIASDLGLRLNDINQAFIDYASSEGQPNQDYLFDDTLHPGEEGNAVTQAKTLNTMGL